MSTADTRTIEWQARQRWEGIDMKTERLRVPGGWVYQVNIDDNFRIVFVPDPPQV